MASKKTIVSLGLSLSGKTNYIASSLVYMATSPTFERWKIKQNNHDFSVFIDEFEGRLNQGEWCDHTEVGDKNVFDFDIPRRLFHFQKSVTVKDWPGEMFSRLVKDDPTIPEDVFRDFQIDCKNAEGFILCLDGKSTQDGDKKKEVQDTLRRFCEILGWLKSENDDNVVPTNIKRNFAIVVTKSDLLVGHSDFCTQGSNLLNLDILNKKIRESYRSFFGILRSQNCGIGVFPVSLVPSRELRKNDPEYGRMPARGNWKLDKVMESSLIDTASRRFYGERYFGNMYGALLWLLERV